MTNLFCNTPLITILLFEITFRIVIKGVLKLLIFLMQWRQLLLDLTKP